PGRGRAWRWLPPRARCLRDRRASPWPREGGEGVGVPGVDLLLAGEERGALGDQLVERAQPRPRPDPLADSVLGSADGIERLNTRRTSVRSLRANSGRRTSCRAERRFHPRAGTLGQ